MDGKRETAETLKIQFLVAALVLIASFALDGQAKEAQAIVLAVIPEWFLLSVSHLGDLVTLAALVAVFFGFSLVRRRSGFTGVAVVLASALVATGLAVLSLKWLAGRGPDGVFHGFGAGDGRIMFPSGHTAMAFAACEVIGLIWPKARWPVFAVAAGVAVSRATLIHHFMSDVVAGALIGVLVGRLATDWAAKKGFLELDSGPDAAPARPPDKR
jgi:membrane-associated phospholipid phosphatase